VRDVYITSRTKNYNQEKSGLNLSLATTGFLMEKALH